MLYFKCYIVGHTLQVMLHVKYFMSHMLMLPCRLVLELETFSLNRGLTYLLKNQPPEEFFFPEPENALPLAKMELELVKRFQDIDHDIVQVPHILIRVE